jgi:hypothetical protein
MTDYKEEWYLEDNKKLRKALHGISVWVNDPEEDMEKKLRKIKLIVNNLNLSASVVERNE